MPQKPDGRRTSRGSGPLGPRPVPRRVPPRRKPVGELARIPTTSSYAPSVVDSPYKPYEPKESGVPYPLDQAFERMPSPDRSDRIERSPDTPRSSQLSFPDPDSYSIWTDDEVSSPTRMPALDSWKSGLSFKDLPEELVPAPAHTLPDLPGLHIHQSGAISVPLDLPQLPPMGAIRPPFDVEQLTVAELEKCTAPWALSGVAQWIDYLVSAIDAEFSLTSVTAALAKLVVFRCPAINWVVADALARQAMESLRQQGFCTAGPDDALQLDHSLRPTGVLTALCGDGCYSPKPGPGCYAPRCIRDKPLEPEILDELPRRMRSQVSVSRGRPDLEMDWAGFWGIKPDEVDATALKLQYAIHELIMTEVAYVRDLNVYVDVYGELENHPSVMADQALFCRQVFARIRDIISVNSVLSARLQGRQHQQGPFVGGIGDLVVQWVQEAGEAYNAYASDYLASDVLLRRETAASPALREWMAERGRDPRLVGVPHSFYFSRVLPRLLRYKLLLGAVLKYTPESSTEHGILLEAQKKVDELSAQCDAKVATAQRGIDVDNLRAHIVFKSADVTADLKLGDRRRKLIKRGELLRRGGFKVDWITSHVLLLDNFLVLSKTREGQNGKAFYVTKLPIPMDLLVLESADLDGEVKFGSKLTLTRGVPVAKPTSGTDGQVTYVEQPKDVLYPLQITHIGRAGGEYFLYAKTSIERERWRDAIVDAKRAHSSSAFARNSEPFRLKLLSDQFRYVEGDAPKLAVPTPNTVLHRCIGDADPAFAVARSRVNSVEAVGNEFLAGLEYGVYRGSGNHAAWFRVLDLRHVQSIRVVEEMNLLLVLADKALLWYDLGSVLNAKPGDKNVPLGRRLNRKKRVYHFTIAYLRDRLVVVYVQQELAASVLKVVEPVRSTSRTMNNIPCVMSFREVDRVHISGDVIGVTPFHFSMIVHNSSNGFQYLSLDVKVAQRFPAQSLGLGKPLAIYRISANALVACYELGCLVVTPTGEIAAHTPITPFVCVAQSVAYQAPYLVAVSPELVEVRKMEAGTNNKAPLVQVITGKDIRLLGTVEGQIRLALAHPRVPGIQLVVAVVGNEFVVIDSTSSISGL